MKYKAILATMVCGATAHGAIVLSEADWDGIDQLNDGNNGVLVTTTDGTMGNTAPAGSTGEVGALDSNEANVWGAVNPPGNTIPIPAGVIAGTDTFSASFDVYIPSGTTFEGGDRVSLILRRNNNNMGGNYVDFSNVSAIAVDTWVTFSVGGVVPAFENDDPMQPAVTGLTPILSFYDPGANAAVGVSAYIDNWSFTVTPEPTTALLSLIGLGALGLRRRR